LRLYTAISELEGRGMEGIPVRTMIPSASTSHSHHFQRNTIIQLSSSSTTTVPTQNRCLSFSVRAKLSSSDFQGTHVTISGEFYSKYELLSLGFMPLNFNFGGLIWE